jgi:hypothetical protein
MFMAADVAGFGSPCGSIASRFPGKLGCRNRLKPAIEAHDPEKWNPVFG